MITLFNNGFWSVTETLRQMPFEAGCYQDIREEVN
jgi:hypothetical protein